jgi:hypothetical protein
MAQNAQPDQATRILLPTLRVVLQVLAALLVSVLVGIAAAPAQAQGRPIPDTARLATLKLGVFPDAELNGKAIKLGPGARIFNRDNMLVIPAPLQGVTHAVAYVTGSLGEVISVWILNDAEVKQLRARLKKSG